MPKKLLASDTSVVEQLACSVCKENFAENDLSMQVSCGHQFHVDCITPWFEMSDKCPSCRAVFTKINIGENK